MKRRQLLGLAASATVALPLVPFAARVAAQTPPPQVTIDELSLDVDSLAAGTMDGVQLLPGLGLSLAGGRSSGSYTSAPLPAAYPFTHAAIRWMGERPEAIQFVLRFSSDGRAWSSWTPVQIDSHAPGTASTLRGAVVSAGQASFIQFRASFSSAGGRPMLQSVTLTTIDAGQSPAPSSLDTLPLASALTPGEFLRREQWGADDLLRFDAGEEIWHRMYVPVKKVVVHHTASSNDYQTIDDAKAEVRAIYAYHSVSLGWGDIGYNAIIDKWGNVYEGRHGRGRGSSREVLSDGVVAGHAFDHNYGSFGVALLGTFTKPEEGEPGVVPSAAMQNALADVLAWECRRSKVDPREASDYLLTTDQWNKNLNNIPGHRDCTHTICPGGYVYERLPALRSAVASRLSGTPRAPTLIAYAGSRARPSEVEQSYFAWGSPGSTGRFLHLLEGWRRRPGSEDVEYLCGFDSAAEAAWSPTELGSSSFGYLFRAFGGESAAPPPGHYTFHVAAIGDNGKPGYRHEHTILVG